MAESYQAVRAGAPSRPSAEPPVQLNARLDLVRENLNGALSTLDEVRMRLGVAAPPENIKPEVAHGGAAETTMNLLALSTRLQSVLRETLEAIG